MKEETFTVLFLSSRHRDRTDTIILHFLSMTSENDITRITHHRKQFAHNRHHCFLILLTHTAAELQRFVDLFPRKRKRPCQKDASLRDCDRRDLERLVFYDSLREEASTHTHTVEKRLVVGIEGRMPCIVENRLALGVWRIGRKSEVQNTQEIEEKRPNLLRWICITDNTANLFLQMHSKHYAYIRQIICSIIII